MSEARTKALANLMEVPAAELTRRRAEFQSAAEAAGLALEEIRDALNARAELPRAMLPEERDALIGLLRQRSFPGRDALLLQAAEATVVGYCSCGCATVDLAVPPTIPRADRVPTVTPASADVSDAEGNVVGGLILFVADGYLSLLEIYDYDAPISPMPSLDRITFGG